MSVVAKRAVWVVAGSVLLSACGSPENVVDDFLGAVDDGDEKKAMGYIDPNASEFIEVGIYEALGSLVGAAELTREDRQKLVSEKITKMIESFQECGGVDEIETNEVSNNKGKEDTDGENTRTVRALVTYKLSAHADCKPQSIKFSLIKSDGKWLISGFYSK